MLPGIEDEEEETIYVGIRQSEWIHCPCHAVTSKDLQTACKPRNFLFPDNVRFKFYEQHSSWPLVELWHRDIGTPFALGQKKQLQDVLMFKGLHRYNTSEKKRESPSEEIKTKGLSAKYPREHLKPTGNDPALFLLYLPPPLSQIYGKTIVDEDGAGYKKKPRES